MQGGKGPKAVPAQEKLSGETRITEGANLPLQRKKTVDTEKGEGLRHFIKGTRS